MDDEGKPEQQVAEAKNRPRGMPFPLGISGNSAGKRIVNERVAVYFEAMSQDFPDMTATERAMLSKACRLLVRSDSTRDSDASARLACAASMLLRTLRSMRRVPERHGSTAPRPRTRHPVGSQVPMRDRLATEPADAE